MPRLPANRKRTVIGVTAAIALGYGTLVAVLSQALVAPPRPRITESARAFVGVRLQRTEAGDIVVTRSVSRARAAGIRDGDRIVRVDGDPVSTTDAVVSRIRRHGEGERVRIEALRTAPDGREGALMIDVPVEVRPVSPADRGLDFQEVAFTNDRGLVLRGWYVPPPAAVPGHRSGAVAYGHGNGTDRRQWLDLAYEVHLSGLGQLLFDFGGRGESDGDTITLGQHESGDLVAGLGFLAARPEIAPDRLALVGRSMGAAAALIAAANHPEVRALVLDSPYADLTRLVDEALSARHLPPFLIRPPLFAVAAVRGRFEPATVAPIASASRIAVPMLLFHGVDDELVPFAHSSDIAAIAGGSVELVPLAGHDHNSRRPPDYWRRIAAFLEVNLAD